MATINDYYDKYEYERRMREQQAMYLNQQNMSAQSQQQMNGLLGMQQARINPLDYTIDLNIAAQQQPKEPKPNHKLLLIEEI